VRRGALLLLVVAAAGAVIFIWIHRCETHAGYGRYTLRVGFDRVRIADEEYVVTDEGGVLYLGGHPLTRGVYRASQPWLYVHRIAEDEIDVTFDEAAKEFYPLYTGSRFAIFNPFAGPCEIGQSSCVQFGDSLWMVLHRWTEEGIVGDVIRRGGSGEEWTFVRGDLLIPADGTEIPVRQLNARVKCASFDPDERTATLVFRGDRR
jgi:hypothetical protein